MKYRVKITNSYKKSYRKCIERGLDVTLLDDIVDKLMNGKKLPPVNKDHQLTGNMKKYRECHIKPDWLLIYRIDKEIITLTLVNTGSHSELLKK